MISEREISMALARTGPVNGYLRPHYPKWFGPREIAFDRNPWEGSQASHRLTRDGAVRLVPTPGHTHGHLSVVVERENDMVLLTGDAAYSARSLLRGTVDGVAQDERAHRRSTELLRDLCRSRKVVIAPSHDPDTPTRLEEAARAEGILHARRPGVPRGDRAGAPVPPLRREPGE